MFKMVNVPETLEVNKFVSNDYAYIKLFYEDFEEGDTPCFWLAKIIETKNDNSSCSYIIQGIGQHETPRSILLGDKKRLTKLPNNLAEQLNHLPEEWVDVLMVNRIFVSPEDLLTYLYKTFNLSEEKELGGYNV